VRLGRRGPRFTGDLSRYRLEHPGNAIGDLFAVNDRQFLVFDRDNGAGATARFKAVFLVDLDDRDHDGYVDKELLVNLMAVPDPANVGGLGAFFTFRSSPSRTSRSSTARRSRCSTTTTSPPAGAGRPPRPTRTS